MNFAEIVEKFVVPFLPFFNVIFIGLFGLKICRVNKGENMYKTYDSARNSKIAQTFSETIDDYVLNPETDRLEKLEIPINIQEKIQSYAEFALDRALDRFLPTEDHTADDVVESYQQHQMDLSVLGEAMDLAESYREEFSLPDNYSIAQIYAEVEKKATDLRKEIGAVREFLQKRKEVNEHGTVSQKEGESAQKQPVVQENSKTNS